MPRRPLFCKTCAELLQELTQAAEAAAEAGSRMSGAIGTRDFKLALQANAQMRKIYLEATERVRRHREVEHGRRNLSEAERL